MLRLLNVNEDAMNKIANSIRRWAEKIDITENDYGLYDIGVHTGVPVIIKCYNSNGDVTIDMGCNIVTLNEDDYSEIKIL